MVVLLFQLASFWELLYISFPYFQDWVPVLSFITEAIQNFWKGKRYYGMPSICQAVHNNIIYEYLFSFSFLSFFFLFFVEGGVERWCFYHLV